MLDNSQKSVSTKSDIFDSVTSDTETRELHLRLMARAVEAIESEHCLCGVPPCPLCVAASDMRLELVWWELHERRLAMGEWTKSKRQRAREKRLRQMDRLPIDNRMTGKQLTHGLHVFYIGFCIAVLIALIFEVVTNIF